MKRITTLSIILSLTIVLQFAVTGAIAKPIVLTYASGYGENFSLSLQDRWWAEEIEKRTNGKVKIEFYWSQGLAKIPETLDAVSTGLADIAFLAIGYFGSQLPLLTCSSNFYLTEKPDAVSKALMEIYRTIPALQEELEKKNNIKPLTFAGSTPLIFGAREPWSSFDQFKGKKVRTFPGLEKPLAELGVIPVAISWGEIYVSLERGVVDAYTGTMWDLAAIGKFYERAPYIIDMGIGTYSAGGTFINMDTWKKLPDDIKKVLEAVTQESLEKQPALFMKADHRAYELYKKAGVKTIVFSEAEAAKMRNLTVPKRWNEWISDMQKKGLPGKEVFDKYKAAVKKFEPESTYVSPFVRYKDLLLK